MADSPELKEMKRLHKGTEAYVAEISQTCCAQYNDLMKAFNELSARVATLEAAAKKKG